MLMASFFSLTVLFIMYFPTISVEGSSTLNRVSYDYGPFDLSDKQVKEI